MPFIQELLKYKNTAIAGLEKNTGKTTCMNYILNRLYKDFSKVVAVTSIGIDGETQDQVTLTSKPEIFFEKGMYFVTSEKFYLNKMLTAKILNIGKENTATGRLITAEVMNKGNCIIAGPDNTFLVKKILKQLESYPIDVTLIDGAISRTSHASPAIAEALVLCTGAALAPSIEKVVEKTAFSLELLNIQTWNDHKNQEWLNDTEAGVWALDSNNVWQNLKLKSLLMLNSSKCDIFEYGNTVFISGAITDKYLEIIRTTSKSKDINIIVKDFTKIFVSRRELNIFQSSGGNLFVLKQPKLIAVCVNPYSPKGFLLDSVKLINELSNKIGMKVFDIKKIKGNS